MDDDPTLPPKVSKVVEKASRAKTAGEARELIAKALDESPDAYLRGEDAKKLTDAVWDRLYAHTLAPEESPDDREDVLGEIRVLHFLRYLVDQRAADPPLSPAELREVRPTIPADVVPPIDPADANRRRDTHTKKVKERLHGVYTKVEAIQDALDDLTSTDRVQRDQLSRTVVEVSTTPPPARMLTGPAAVRRRSEADARETLTAARRRMSRPSWYRSVLPGCSARSATAI